MFDDRLKEYLKRIESDYSLLYEEKDKQTSFYFDQMIELMYNELLKEVQDQNVLYSLVYSVFKKNLGIIFDNMKKYVLKVSKDSKDSFNEVIKLGTSNRYIEISNLNELYKNFQNEVIRNLQIDNKVESLISTNTDVLKSQLYSKTFIENKNNADDIIKRYTDILVLEMAKNINSKKDFLLTSYREFIDNILKDVYEQRDVVIERNLKLIINTAYAYLKEKEYINIDKYADINFKFINESFASLEEKLFNTLNIKRTSVGPINPVKDYLLGFNNTIRIKIQNVFDEMNFVVMLDKEELNDKVKEFNDLISHIYEIKLVFDRQFLEYKREFNVSSKDSDKFDEIFKRECSRLTDGIKANISNIFRDNIKIYNDVIYRTLLLKSKVYEYPNILSYEKVKDLLFK